MRHLLSVLIAMAFAGCSLWSANETDDVRLANNTEQPIIYLALERQSSNLVDPSPELPIEGRNDRLVQIGETADVNEIQGWEPGDDIRFFIYAAPAEADTATLESLVDVTNEELQAQNYLVTIDTL